MKKSYQIYKKILYIGALCLSVLAIQACSSSDEILDAPAQSVIEDPIYFSVISDNPQIKENVELSLAQLPIISKKKFYLYRAEVRDITKKATRALGYYNPNIEIEVYKKGNNTKLKEQIDKLKEDLTLSKKKELEVKVIIDEGKPLFIRNCDIEILGEGANTRIFQNILKNSSINSYDILDHSKYEAFKTKLEDTSLSLGYFDAKLISSRILVFAEQNVADINLVFDTGKRYSFGPFRAVDEKTEELLKPVESLMTLKEGDKFSTRKLTNLSTTLSSTNYYQQIDIQPKVKESEDYKIPVDIQLERKAHNLVSLGVGYSTDEGARIKVDWEKPLLNSYGHSFSSYAKLSQIAQDANIIYKIPYENPLTNYFYLNAAQTHTDFNDTLSDRSHFSVHYVSEEPKEWRYDWALKAEYEDYEQGSDEGYVFNVMPSLKLSKRQVRGIKDPREGYIIGFEFDGGTKAISDLNFYRAKANFKWITSPTLNTRFIVRAEQGGTFGGDWDKVPPSLRYFAGGDNSIRGYGYMDLAPSNKGGLNGGRYLTTASIEYQFPFGFDNQRLAIFVDGGMATNDYDNFSDDFNLGPGIGYRYISSYGTLRIDLGVAVDDDPTTVKLHFAFGPEM